MFCTNCGAAIPEGAKFCTSCGAVAPASFNTSEPQAPEIPAQEPAFENTPAETVSEVTEPVTETPVNTGIPDTAAGAAAAGAAAFGASDSGPAKPKPQGTWYDQPYTMSQTQVNEGNYRQQQQQQQAANAVDAKESFKNPSFGEAIQSFFLRYVDFKGRSSRAEYWYVVLASYLIGIAFGVLASITKSGIFTTIESLYSFLVFIPSLAIWFRRLHDTGRSGWYIFVMLLPIVGWILMLIWLCSTSDGGNIYGPEPRMK